MRRHVALDPAPGLHQILQRLDQGLRHQGYAVGDTLEIPLGEVVWQPGYVVHVPVGKQHVIDRNRLPRTLADIEAAVQLRRDDDGLLAGDAVARQREIAHVQLRQHVRPEFHCIFRPHRMSGKPGGQARRSAGSAGLGLN